MNLPIVKKPVQSFFLYPFLILLFIFIWLQFSFPDFERFFFWGEIFCIGLAFTSFNVPYQIELQKKIILMVYVWLFLFSTFSLLMTFILWREECVPYYLFRHLVFFYYAFFFFAGYKWGDLQLDWLGKFFAPIFILSFLKLFFIQNFLGSIVWFGMLWLAFLKKYNEKRIFLFGCVFLIILNYFLGGSGTDKLNTYFIITIPLLLFLLRTWNTFLVIPKRALFVLLLIVGIIALIVKVKHLGGVAFQMNAVGRAIEDMPQKGYITPTRYLNPWEDFFDYNAWWRIIFWVYLLFRFFDHPLGIGLGTPFFDAQFSDFLHMPIRPGDEYVITAHNFFLTLLVRLGVPFLIFFSLLFFYCCRLVMRYLTAVNFNPLRDPQSRIVFGSCIVFCAALILASFNVVLESPLHAWFVWYTFGFFVRFVGDYVAKWELYAK